MNNKSVVTKIPLKTDINLDPVSENVFPFEKDENGESIVSSQLINNTGYAFEGGVATLHQIQKTEGNNPSYSYTTEGGNFIELIPNGNDPVSNAPMSGVYLDGKFLDNVPSHGVESVQAISGNYDDMCLTDGNPVGMKILSNPGQAPQIGTGGSSWTARTSTAATGSGWVSVAYGNGVYVAVSQTTSTTGAIQTSTDGITWTARTSTAASGSGWSSVAFGNGLFVVVALSTSTTGAIQTSPDGINWTARTSTPGAGSGWRSVAYGNGIFVAIGSSTGFITQVVQTSSDGITWTAQTLPGAPLGGPLFSITYGNGLFVAVASTTNVAAVETSPDGINWTRRNCTAATSGWVSVTYGNGLFVAIAGTTSTSGAIQTSPDGINWTARTSTAASGTGWRSVTYGNGVYVAVAISTSTTGAVQTSTDGINWTARTSTASAGGWNAVTYGNALFVVVGATTLTAGAIQTSPITFSTLITVKLDEVSSSGQIVNTVTYTISGAGFSKPIALIKQALGNMFSWSSPQYFLAADSSTTYNIFDTAGVKQLTTSIPVAFANGAPKYLWAAKFAAKNDYMIVAIGAVGSVANPSSYIITSTGGGAPFTNTNTGLTYSWAVMQSLNGFNRIMMSGQTNPAGVAAQHLVFYGYNFFTASYTTAPTLNAVTNSTDLATQPASSSYGYIDIVHTDYHHYYSGVLQPTTLNYATGVTTFTDLPNSSGPINSFGRLSFVDESDYGQKPPFEFRLNMIKTGTFAAAPQFISVANPYGINGQTSIGVPISTFGEFDPSFGPQIGASWNTVLWRDGFVYYLAKISTTPIRPIQKITSNLYKINSISPLNVVNVNAKALVLGSNDYTSSMLISGGTNSGTTWVSTNIQWAAGSQNAANSIDVGGELVSSSGAFTPIPIGNSIPSMHQTLNYYTLSFFSGTGVTANTLSQAWRADGQLLTGTQLLSGFQNQIAGLSTTYISNTSLVPVPLGSRFAGYTIGTNSSATSLAFNETYITSGYQGVTLTSEWDGYILGNQLQVNGVSFSLFGQPYLFDGKNIFKLIINNGAVSVPISVLVRADGLIFLTTSFQYAFFYSPFDNSVWDFNGGYGMEKFKRLDGMGAIQNGSFNAYSNTLTIITSNFITTYRDNFWSAIPRSSSMTPDGGESTLRIYDTVNGPVFGNTFNLWNYTYFNKGTLGTTVSNGITTIETVYPFNYQTSFIGPDENKRMVLSAITFSIYNESKAPLSIAVNVFGYDQDGLYQQSPTKTFLITPSMYSGGGFVPVLRIQPQHQRFIAASVQFLCSTDMRIYDLHYHWTEEDQAIPSPARSR